MKASPPSAPNPVRVAVATHGCKLNQAESDSIGRSFSQAGCQVVDPKGSADIYVLNTCSVTHVAEGKARRWLRSAHRRNPQASIIATGCYSSRAKEELEGLEGVSLVVGNQDKDRLAEIVEISGLLEKYGSLPISTGTTNPFASPLHRTRAAVKIQDGCNQFCAFCVVPLTRGRESNLPMDDVIELVRSKVEEGYKEVVLTGPQIGSYGLYPPTAEARKDYDSYDGRLHRLIERVLGETEIERLRISSIQPQDLTDSLLRTWEDPRLCRHVHMALQSGSDAVLQRMRRRYRSPQYREAVERLREAVPGIAITTDVIVGFPQETDKEFDEGYQFCLEMGFAGMHVFPYSPRPGTSAAEMQSGLPESDKKYRLDRMLALAHDSASRFRRSFIGQKFGVLWEDQEQIAERSMWSGLTDNYIRVYSDDERLSTNQITSTLLTTQLDNGLLGIPDVNVESMSGVRVSLN